MPNYEGSKVQPLKEGTSVRGGTNTGNSIPKRPGPPPSSIKPKGPAKPPRGR
jgi:hypothetical protein